MPYDPYNPWENQEDKEKPPTPPIKPPPTPAIDDDALNRQFTSYADRLRLLNQQQPSRQFADYTQTARLQQAMPTSFTPDRYDFSKPATTFKVDLGELPKWLPPGLRSILEKPVTMTGGPPGLRQALGGTAAGASPPWLYQWLPPGLQQAMGIPPTGQPEPFELLYGGGAQEDIVGGTLGALAGLTDDFVPGTPAEDTTDYSWPIYRRGSYTPRAYPVSARSGPRTPRGRRSLGLTSWRI